MKKLIVTLALFAGISSYVFCQKLPPLGKPIPDFTFSRITHYAKQSASLSDFKGKWLFLDFWFTGCSSCIKSFPKVNNIQQSFKNDITYVLVGLNNKEYGRNIEEVFEKLRAKQNLQLIAAYDSVLNEKWGISSMPCIIIVDPNGIVRHITDGRDMTNEKIEDLIAEKPVSFFDWTENSSRLPINPDDYNSSENAVNSGSVIYRSLLTKWNGEEQNGGLELDIYTKPQASEIWKNGFQLTMVNLEWLYNFAYYGKYYFRLLSDSMYGIIHQHPILEIKDSTLFEYSYAENFGKGLYNYNLTLPSSQVTKENIMYYMQQDLKRVFGYDAAVEVRNMPVWKLIAEPGAGEKLRTKGGQTIKPWSEGSTAAGFSARNSNMKYVFWDLVEFINEKEEAPFIDATGIDWNVDFSIDADMTDINDIKKELGKQGLDLIRDEKPMKVLVIRDAKK